MFIHDNYSLSLDWGLDSKSLILPKKKKKNFSWANGNSEDQWKKYYIQISLFTHIVNRNMEVVVYHSCQFPLPLWKFIPSPWPYHVMPPAHYRDTLSALAAWPLVATNRAINISISPPHHCNLNPTLQICFLVIDNYDMKFLIIVE